MDTSDLAEHDPEFMSDKTRQRVAPVRKMLDEGFNIQALGEATNQVVEGAFRSLVEHIDELEMDLAALRTSVAMKEPIAESEEVARLRAALNLALKWLEPREPPDSRAVSNEFVAMAAVACGCANDDCMKIIGAAIAEYGG